MRTLLLIIIKLVVSVALVALGLAGLVAGAIFITHVLGYQYGWDQTVRDILALLMGAILFSLIGGFLIGLWRGNRA